MSSLYKTLKKLEQILNSNMKHIKAKSVKEGVDCADFADRRLIHLLKQGACNRIPFLYMKEGGGYKWSN